MEREKEVIYLVIVPTIIEKNINGEHAYDLYSCLLKERIIILCGEIDDAMSREFDTYKTHEYSN